MRLLILTLTLVVAFASDLYGSGAFPLDDPPGILMGSFQTYTIKDRETLVSLARTHDVGFNEIADANRHVDPWVPDKGSEIIIPTSWLIPDIIDEGIIINIAELRLYHFFSTGENRYISTYPIGIGQQGFHTPVGDFRVTGKIKDPVWRIPSSFRDEYPDMPDFVPPGPDNPLGKYWLQLSIKGYGIHGTNKPYGIGRRVSHGCIRLYPEDIEFLFNFIAVGTNVIILNEPIKAGTHKRKVYIEIHRGELNDSALMMEAVRILSRKHLLEHTDTELLIRAIKNATGLPAVISK